MKILAVNKKANFDYSMKKSMEAGIMLSGSEVKSAKNGGANMKAAYIVVGENSASVIGLHIRKYGYSNESDYDPEKTRAILLNKKEIRQLRSEKEKDGISIIATKLYINSKGRIKIEISIAQGKKKYDKRQSIKERDIMRSAQRYK